MPKMLYRTRGNALPGGKPRVYFTCHPEDFEKYFDRVCEDILKTQDCAIFYTEDMTAPFTETEQRLDLGYKQLFVVPVTGRLLTTQNRAMNADLAYAKQENIPILPFLMEDGLDALYKKPENFGSRQHLSPNRQDPTALPYEEKLARYLKTRLIGDTMATRVRHAFAAYIFLSYRQKDRSHANELMRLIHQKPLYRDVAIWYDEFLPLGESFRQNIEKALHNSQLFALLVTPNLLERPDGEPNFVMGEEYPMARDAGIDILPLEMVKTDPAALASEYAQLPACVDPTDEEALLAQLATTLSDFVHREAKDDPTHNFLIGIAYLEGIDMERDRQRGLALVTKAAEAGLHEAMEQLYEMYHTGSHVQTDYQKAREWIEKLYRDCLATLGPEAPETLRALQKLAYILTECGQYPQALARNRELYDTYCRIQGKYHANTLQVAANLALAYCNNDACQEAIDLAEDYYQFCLKFLGEAHMQTLHWLNHLAHFYGRTRDRKKARAYAEKAYLSCSHVLGQEHIHTMTALSNYATACCNQGDRERSAQLNKTAWDICCRTLGPEHPQPLIHRSNLADDLRHLGDEQVAAREDQAIYDIRCRVLGKDHPQTLTSLNNLACNFADQGHYEEAIRLFRQVYDSFARTLGATDQLASTTLRNLAMAGCNLGDHSTAEWAYFELFRTAGPQHAHTLSVCTALDNVFITRGLSAEAVSFFEKVHAQLSEALGQDHPLTRNAREAVEFYRR